MPVCEYVHACECAHVYVCMCESACVQMYERKNWENCNSIINEIYLKKEKKAMELWDEFILKGENLFSTGEFLIMSLRPCIANIPVGDLI